MDSENIYIYNSNQTELTEQFTLSYTKKKIVLFKPTTLCNLKCKYCYYELNTELMINQLISEDEFNSAIEKVDINDGDILFLSGGEYLIHPRSLDFIKTIRNIYTNISIILTTNGVNLKRKKFLPLLNSVDCIQISLDSVSSSYHDIYRGKQNETISSILSLKDFNFNLSLIVVLSKKNISEFHSILSFAIDNNINSIFIQLLWLPEKHQLYDELVLTEKDLDLYNNIMDSLISARCKIKIPPVFYLKLLREAISNNLSKYAVKNCFGLDNLLTIDPYGNINNCLPAELLQHTSSYPTTENLGNPAKDNNCAYFSVECLCFFGHLAMDYANNAI